MTLSLVTVIIPTKQEADDIEGCIDAVAAQDHPVNRLEVIVVDGCSSDGTADIARRRLARWGFASTAVISNPAATTSSNLNVGLAHASGAIVCRVDARTRIQPHYVRTCASVLASRPDVAVVGGAQVAIARDPTARAVGIARALNNRWSMGGSAYRRASASGPSDTVYLGAFRRDDLEAAGGWDERLVTNQDFDLNRRMAERGVVWFESTLRSGYVPRPTLRSLRQQYQRFGAAKVDYWRATGDRPQPRQQVLLIGPLMAAGSSLAVLAVSEHRLRTASVLAGATIAALGYVEVRGSDGPNGGPAGHAVGTAAVTTVAVSWWWGAVRRLLGRT